MSKGDPVRPEAAVRILRIDLEPRPPRILRPHLTNRTGAAAVQPLVPEHRPHRPRQPFESWTDRLLAAAVILALAGLVGGLADTASVQPTAPAQATTSQAP